MDAAAEVAQYELDNANTQARSYRECRKLVIIVKIGGLLIYQEYYRFKPSFRLKRRSRQAKQITL